jgi:hypothetical protein
MRNLVCSMIVGSVTCVIAGGCGSASPSYSMSPPAPAAVAPTQQASASPSPSPEVPNQVAVANSPTPGGGTRVSEDAPTYQTEITRARHERLSSEQVATWAQQGTRDDIIIDRIERAQTIFRLSAADEQSLRQQGVSEDVICAMRETARR